MTPFKEACGEECPAAQHLAPGVRLRIVISKTGRVKNDRVFMIHADGKEEEISRTVFAYELKRRAGELQTLLLHTKTGTFICTGDLDITYG